MRDAVYARKQRVGSRQANGDAPKIKFLGLYDTVGSFGIPGNKRDVGKDFSIHAKKKIKTIRHAVAAHERRKNFELTSIFPYKGYYDPTGRMIEMTFPGAHSDVGGGYADDYLSRLPFLWMYYEMKNAGVILHKKTGMEIYNSIQGQSNGTGVHNSNYHYPRWTGLGWLPAWTWHDHPILSKKELRKLQKTERTIFYYDSPQERLRR